ncbi:hypothetical protein PABY_13330 [Pyrodictium abyssi]|uniref:Nucleoside phosphorylase domain-containing protein n=1 Tax=Pyrodictium abyssi TaxID=54256 RepID=A0ABM8IW27_9CREN|nr:hypothetical protein PABY_13330 [Pyrodictium abyssi]
MLDSPRYWVENWVRSSLGGRDPSVLGKVIVPLLGGGFQRVEKVLGRDVEKLDNTLHTIRVWRHRRLPVSFVALAGGPHYVEVLLALACAARAEYILGLGWCGALKEQLGLGSVVVAYAAVRGDGASENYVNPRFPAVADPVLAVELHNFLRRRGLEATLGLVYTTSSHMTENKLLREWADKPILCVECETATLYTIASLLGIRTVVALVVSDSLAIGGLSKKTTDSATDSVLRYIAEFAAMLSRSMSQSHKDIFNTT